MLPNKSYTFSTILHLLRRNRWLVITPLILCLLVALVVSSSLADRFQSDMLIQLIPQPVSDGEIRSKTTSGREDRLDVVSRQVTSRAHLEEMIRDLDLFPRDRARLPMETVVDLMRSHISIERVRSANNEPVDAFHVKFTYSDAGVALKVTQRLGSLYVDRGLRDRGSPGAPTSSTSDELPLQQAVSQDVTIVANQGRASAGEQFHMLYAARVPVTPIGPNRLRISAAGLGVGLALGLGCLLFLELRDTSLRTEADVREVLALPVVALVPRIETAADVLAVKRRAHVSLAAAVTFFAVSGYVFWSLKLWKFVV